jgi:hypothetical protein
MALIPTISLMGTRSDPPLASVTGGDNPPLTDYGNQTPRRNTRDVGKGVKCVPFGWLRGSTKGITRDVGKGVKCVPEMFKFCNPHLFLRRESHKLINHTISLSGGRLSWVILMNLGVPEGFSNGFNPLHLPTFLKHATLPSLAAKPNPRSPVPLLN